MAKRVSIKHKRKEAPEWVFPWRPRGESYFPKLLALVFVTLLFALLISSVKIQLTAPAPWAAKRASVIVTTSDSDSRALTLRAQEGGPFPSRFEPSEWKPLRDLEAPVFAAARWNPPPYQPALRPLPEKSPSLPLLVDRGEPVLPTRRAPSAEAPPVQTYRLVPVIYPLSGIDHASIPTDLPAFGEGIDADLMSEAWRFLVRLGPAGNVEDCVSLTGGDEKRQLVLADWLKRVIFPKDVKAARWISVAVGFSNQPNPSEDGTLDH